MAIIFLMKFLIVKTSSLGDILQSFPVVEYLRKKFPEAQIDWVVERAGAALLSAHPDLHRVIIIDTNAWGDAPFSFETWRLVRKFYPELRETEYDVLFDLQGNIKSACITACAKAKEKVGFDWASAREKLNFLATSKRYYVAAQGNIRLRYLQLVQQYFEDTSPFEPSKTLLKLTAEESERLDAFSLGPSPLMVCFGSRWQNKRLPDETLEQFLALLEESEHPAFLFVWGGEEERLLAERLTKRFPGSQSIGELSLPLWQALMQRVDSVIAMDSASLHLCGTTSTPSFSCFGPSSAEVYRPLGVLHHSIQGSCPYGRTFDKHCPILRSCPTGACLRSLTPEALLRAFRKTAV